MKSGIIHKDAKPAFAAFVRESWFYIFLCKRPAAVVVGLPLSAPPRWTVTSYVLLFASA